MTTSIRSLLLNISENKSVNLLIVLVAGAIMPLSLAPFSYWPVGILSIVLLLMALQGASTKQAVLRGWLYGVGMHGVGVSWVYVSIHEFGNAPVPLATFLIVFFVSGLSLFQIVPAYLYSKLFRDKPLGVLLAFPCLWVLHEWTRVWFLTGFPWLFLGYAHLQSPLAGWAPITGVLGISLAVALTASAIYYLATQVLSNKQKIGVISLLIAPWLVGILLAQVQWVSEKDSIKVSLIQGNIAQDNKWRPEQVQPIINTYKSLSANEWQDSDIVVWPEAAITLFYQQAALFIAEMGQIASKNNATLITGIPSREPDLENPANRYGIFRNTAIAIGQGEGVYQKQRLVPFGEYVPLEGILRGFIEFFDLPMSRAKPGSSSQLGLKANDLVISMSICYEVVYADLVALTTPNPDLLMTISNDIWFGGSLGPLQHLEMAQMRALENGRYMVRATNNGISAIINEKGELLKRSGQFTREVVRGEAKIMSGTTPFSQIGSLPIVILCFLGLAVTLFLGRGIKPSN